MFGYVKINKLELKVKEYYKYRGYYCGLCMALKEEYGQISRMTLNYDMTFLILLLSSLYEVPNSFSKKRCLVHPVHKQNVLINDITKYAAAMNVILAYFNLKDNWQDDKDVKSLAANQLLKSAYNRAKVKYPKKNEVIEAYLQKIFLLEQQGCQNPDEISNEFGYLMGELLSYKKDMWTPYLEKIGFYLGKYIYLLDAYEDLEEDIKGHKYNPFKGFSNDEVKEIEEKYLMMNLSFMEHAIDQLPLIQDKGILDNIIYSGILINHQKTTEREDGQFNERSL